MKLRGLKRCSGMTKEFGNNGLENHIYYDRRNNIVWCAHEPVGESYPYPNGIKLILKSTKHITMNEIRYAIGKHISNSYKERLERWL